MLWAICLACALPVVFTWTLPFKSNRDRPDLALEVLTDEVECFSDYMTLWIPRSHVEGLRQWLSRILHLPGTWRTPSRLDPFLVKCGYFLHPDPNGDFIFRALYSACFVQKEKANYRLEIRIFQKGVRRLEQSDGYVMKCPVTTARLGQMHIHCGPTFIQVSRPMPLGSSSGQTQWLLALRGELVASLEDASLIGLYVDINATTITIQSPRPELLQRQQVLNTSTELLSLWLVSGYSAYSLEATCPPVSPQPELEVSVHIPKQRLGLVKRGFHIKESLNLKFLRVHQLSTFIVTENWDFVVVSFPAEGLLQVQQCQDGQGARGTQASYRVDLSLEFAEMATPVLWTVESFFQCVGSGTELPALASILRTTSSPESPGPETPPVGMPSAASSQKGLGPRLQRVRPMGRRWPSTVSNFPRVMQEVTPPRPSDLWRSGHLIMSPASEPPVTLTESLETVSPKHGPAQSPGNTLVLGGWSSGNVAVKESDQAREEFQPSVLEAQDPLGSPAEGALLKH
ncbi:PREDICTED: uncharacterized protein C1orf127 homolog [Chrysochloris asiatica]|uniref:Uncharacterized protein C1orf127 homolog n=1 Tax=Chrysochloris asiatica TaxID=185453 RepID=A0A9B0TLU9_CHRAS|nr:PREDICTED: uncharacterized protein C1orf127 homolog [Chrysochloris asiatica]